MHLLQRPNREHTEYGSRPFTGMTRGGLPRLPVQRLQLLQNRLAHLCRRDRRGALGFDIRGAQAVREHRRDRGIDLVGQRPHFERIAQRHCERRDHRDRVGLANPIAMIASFAMALRYSFEMGALADKVDSAIAAVLANGLRTADIKSEGTTAVSTIEMGEAILKELQALHGQATLRHPGERRDPYSVYSRLGRWSRCLL